MTDKDTAASANEATPFLQAGSELRRPILPILKLTSAGQWVFGVENTVLTECTFSADVQNAEIGFVCFVDHRPIDEVMVPVALGKRVSRNELPNHGPNPWVPSASIQLRSTKTGDSFVFKTTSQGGRSAIAALLTEYGQRRQIGKRGIPVIEVGVHRKERELKGTAVAPSFLIVAWEEEVAPLNPEAVSLGEELQNNDIPF